MNALMTIQVRVLSAAALAQLKALQAQSYKTAGGVGAVGKQAAWGLPYLSKWGNQVQWAGRQLMYNFTLPIALAIGAATKFALANEKAMVRVTKVYGDNSPVFNRLAKTEIPALAEAFEALSNKFGVQQDAVISIGADWAAAGASGIALAKSVDLTLKTMVLGEIEAKVATEQLIAIQAQYGQNTRQLTKTIEILNMVENQTGISMKGLMDGMSRAAGVARTAGVDVEHLAAMMAALTPATGSAANAGNGLKTIISRVLSPTKEASDVMKEMGVEVNKLAWQGMTATERLEAMANQFDVLSDAQQAHVATVMASRWQINRFVTLMRDVNNENGYYQKSLSATADEQKLFTQAQKELNRVLTSNPQMLKQTWVILQNAMAKVIVPLLPYIVYLAQQMTMLIQKFTELSPEVQKLALAGLIFLAVIGPIARYVGSVSNLIGLLSAAFHFLGAKLLFVFRPLALVRVGLMALGGTLLALPKLAAAAGGQLINVFARVFTGSVLMSPWTALWSKMAAVARAGAIAISGVFAPLGAVMIAAWHGVLNPIKAAWVIMVARLKWIWILGQAAIMQAWIGFQAVMIAAIASFGAGMAAGFRAVQTAILIGWVAFQRTLVALQAGAAMAIRVIHISIAASGAALMTGLAGLAAAAAGMARLALVAVAGLFTKLPMLVLRSLMGLIPVIFAAITSPIGLAVLAALGLVYAFRDKLATAWGSVVDQFRAAANAMPSFFQPVGEFFHALGQRIMDAFWALPEGVRGAMIAVLTVVRDAALQVYEWMSYLNPFARHSPSLVEQVTKGMDVIGSQYNRAGKMGAGFKKLHAELEAGIKRQEAVVDRWQHKLQQANYALDDQQWKLDRLKDKLDDLQGSYDRHKDAAQRFADAPIDGMERMNDKIFNNELAQKKLRLEMLKWEQVNGPIENIQSRIQSLYGDIEMLRGEATSLHMAGAGSDVLGPIEAQIASMEAQAKALAGAVSASPVTKMQTELDELQRKGEILGLQNDIKFDPMVREIDKLANAQKELSYEQIINGIKREKAAMAALQPGIDKYNAAVNNQQVIVDRLTLSRDKISRRYDAENDKLQHMKDRLSELTDAMNKNGSAADKLSKKSKSAGYTPIGIETFRAGAGANWADPGTQAKIGRQGGMGDQSELIRKFAEQTNTDMAGIFGSFDMFAPLKRWWSKTWTWLKENIGPVVGAVGDGIKQAIAAIGNPFGGAGDSSFVKGAKRVWDTIADIVRTAWDWIKGIIALFAPDFKRIWDAIVKGGKKVWNEIGPELAKFGKLFGPIGDALAKVWQILKPVVAIIGGALLLALKIVSSVISRVFWPVLEFIIDTVKNIIRVFRGLIEFVVGVFTGDWRLAWQGIVDVFSGIFGQIWAILKGVGKVLWGIVSGIVMGIYDFFVWLWDALVGHSIVPDMIDGIFAVFKTLAKLPRWVWNNILKPIYNFFKSLWTDWVKPALKLWWSGIKNTWNGLKKVGIWVWDNVLKPVWDWAKELWERVKRGFARWWDGIKNVWSGLKKVGRWVWDNVFVPVWNWAKELWERVKTGFGRWWEGIKNVWNSLKGLGRWVWDNVMTPVFDKIKQGWEKVKGWLQDNKDFLLDPAKSMVNGVITAINFMIKGLNKISDVLPGIDFHINPIQKLAEGGSIPTRRVGSGFMTRGARAIVGEGKANHPEFVIPTDPTHRRRALALHQMAGAKLGLHDQGMRNENMRAAHQMYNGVPGYDIGGVLGDLKSLAKGASNWVSGNVKKLATVPYQAFDKAAEFALNQVGWKIPREIAQYGREQIKKWIMLADTDAEKLAKMQTVPKGGSVPVSDPGNPGGHSIWHGGEFSNRFIAHMEKAQQLAKATISVMQGGFRPTTSYSGTSHRGDAVDLQVDYKLIRALRQVGIAAGDRTGLGNWGPHTHAVPGPGAGYAAGSAVWQFQDYMAKGGQNQAYNSPWGLAEGGIVRARRGGLIARVGEGQNDEAVVPLPKNWRTDIFGGGNKQGDTIIQINGNLEFPNINSSDDAEAFIENLVILAKG